MKYEFHEKKEGCKWLTAIHHSLHTANKTQKILFKATTDFFVGNNKGLRLNLEGRNCLFRGKKLNIGVKFLI